MKNKLIKLSILLLETVLLYVLLNFNIGCFFKSIFKIRCPGCGLTRAFISLFNLDFITAFKYNILSIPLFISIILINILLVYDIIFNKNKSNILIKKISKHYILIIIIFFITMIINNINKI